VNFHPASQLLAWVGAAVALQELSLAGLLVALAMVLPFALALAGGRLWRMVRRSRWLFLSLAVLFVFGSPGEYLPALPGATREGLQLASEHILRLFLLLQLLALLLQRLAVDRLMGGLYLLLAPAAWVGFDRAQAVARLMLVLDYVQGDDGETHWRDWLTPPPEAAPMPLTLPVRKLHGIDYAVLVLLTAGVLGGVLQS
jgi:hypothetical protein